MSADTDIVADVLAARPLVGRIELLDRGGDIIFECEATLDNARRTFAWCAVPPDDVLDRALWVRAFDAYGRELIAQRLTELGQALFAMRAGPGALAAAAALARDRGRA